MIQTVTIPFPPAAASPNKRGHWSVKARANKVYRQTTYWCCKEQNISKMTGPMRVSITFYPPDKRRRDQDNMLASLKSGLDGIAEAIGVDDSQFVLSMAVGDPVRGGKVVVTLISKLVSIEMRGQIT